MDSKVYITTKQSPTYRQMTLEELFFETIDKPYIINHNLTNTRTRIVDRVSPQLSNSVNHVELIRALSNFNEFTKSLHNKQRETLYSTFYVPKKGKGMPYIFKNIFAMQKKYVECDTAAVFKELAAKVKEMLSSHPTELDEKISTTVSECCAETLVNNGFKMTAKDFEVLIKESYRRIDEPNPELKGALYQLKSIFEDLFGALYHTTAFAYIKGRSTLDAVKRHQANESKWFGKYDLSNFFGSTTVDFIMKQLSITFPFSEIVKYSAGRDELYTALSLCTLKGVLPQGTPISPLITNIIMIPIDHKLSNTLKDFNKQHYVYTRYADDFLISSKYAFKFKDIEKLIIDTLTDFEAPFTINTKKTRYGSSSGSNWNLGVMLNKDNKITVGYKKKRQFQAMIASYVMDSLHGKRWDKTDVMELNGYRNYYKMVEGDTIDKIIEHIGQKFGVNVIALINEDLRS